MIFPTADETLESIIDTFERYIAPEVQDEYAASLCRTVSQMLRSVRARVATEGAVLYEDNSDLRDLLASLRPAVPSAAAAEVDAALAVGEAAAPTPLEALQEEALRLRGALTACLEHLPDRESEPRRAVREYLSRHLERRRPWTVEAFTGPRR